MKRTVRQFVIGLTAAVVLTLSSLGTSSAVACPMCKAANEEDDAKPRAYMYSILFMLTVPATIVSTLTFGLVVVGRREAQGLADAGLVDEVPSNSPHAGDASTEPPSEN